MIYPWTGLNGLDKKLVAEIGEQRGGFFIEAGGNDGIRQSNTFYLARKRGWSGVLVEAIPSLAAQCSRNRPESTVINCALVSSAQQGQEISMVDVDLMSMVDTQAASQEEALTTAERVQGLERQFVKVKGETLSNVIDALHSPEIDLLSLDVEGHEIDVLQGLDLIRHSPRWVLIETQRLEQVAQILESTHELIKPLSHHDYLFKRRK